MTKTSAANSAQILAERFAAHARHWSQGCGAPETSTQVAQRAAFLVSMAVAAGHVCIHLDDFAVSATESPIDDVEVGDLAVLRKSLLASGIVGTPEARDAMPLILDNEDRLYLHRYFDYECRLALCLARRASATVSETASSNIKERINALFAANEKMLAGAPDWQKIAAAMALLGNVTIISGGPGTGKTTTVVNILACLLEQDPDARIVLAAPTGKAAVRMTEAIRQRAAHLPAKLPQDILENLPVESFTIHRLLGVTQKRGEFRHQADNLLPIDALVVDEASMLDLALATKLFEAVPETARIILLGDKDQLAAVESGAVFAELSADPSLSPEHIERIASLCNMVPEAVRAPAVILKSCLKSSLQDHVIWLDRNFRFSSDSEIGRLAAEINAGNSAAVIARLDSPTDDSLQWMDDGGPSPSPAAIGKIIAGYTDYLNAVHTDERNLAAITDAFNRFRTLCAVRDGNRGVAAINQVVSRHFRRTLDHPLDPGGRSEWYPGRPVMVSNNDYVLKLFNGDIGIVLPDESGALMAYFPDRDLGFRAVAPIRLPEHETAFAMTVHKAQGSEFEEVVVMLPGESSRVLTRELIYTAITRAKRRATIIGPGSILDDAIRRKTVRRSGLAARLRDIPID
jgi:exodeoxyribonuclease V alpha subunit